MGAAGNAIDDNWTLEGIDDGWCLGEEEPAKLLRALPTESSEDLNMGLSYEPEEQGGWLLAIETPQEVPAVKASSTLLVPLSDEEVEAFSRANLAMGTVDMPTPDDSWFQEMRSLVPRRRAPTLGNFQVRAEGTQPKVEASTTQEANASVERAPEPEASLEIQPPATKKRWWSRLRRS